MPFADPKARSEYNRQYRLDHQDELKEYDKRYYSENIEQIRARQREFRAANPGRYAGYRSEWAKKNRRRRRLAKYGLTPAQYSDLLVSQDGLCAVCYEQPATDVDHDHATGAVRGLLCGKCNTGLGQFDDDPERLRYAIEYVIDTRNPINSPVDVRPAAGVIAYGRPR
jgi:hypothetical protein